MDSAFAIICWKNRILLFLRDNIPTIPNPNCWQLPGVEAENRETPLRALKRELIEEASYIPESLKYLGKVKRRNGYTYLYSSFVASSEAVRFKHGGTEGQMINFFTLGQMEKLKLPPKLKKRLVSQRDSLEKAFKEKSFEGFKL